MALQTEAQWKEFFKTSGITDDAASTTYAKSFVVNGFNEHSLPQLDKETLTEVGITMIGHKLAIIQRASKHTSPSAESTTVAKASVTAKLSTLTLEMTRPQYRKFQQDWVVYKQITNLQPARSTAHLYNACNDEVQMSLINTHPDFLSMNEEDALKAIEPIVTVRSNPAVHRKAFGELIQGENQTVKNFVVRLRSAATDCAFQCPNPECQYDLSSINIKDQFIRGLNNSTLQAEILAKTNQLKTLDDVTNYAESFETAIRDQNTLSNNTGTNDTAFKFSHKKHQKQQQQQQQQQQSTSQYLPSQRPCNGCGDETHGRNRNTQCSAWGKDCHNCGKPNHLAKVCRQKSPLNNGPQG